MADSVPLVSVIIPTYNRAQLLPRAIQSVLDQTFKDFELFIVDDASTDETEAAARRFNDSRIIYLRHEENKGGSAARNTGIRASRGAYVAFLDSDDEWLPSKLEKQLRLFAASEVTDLGVVMCGVRKIGLQGQPTGSKVLDIRGHVHDSLFALEWNPLTVTLLVRRDCLQEELFDERLPGFQDWDLCLRLSRRYGFDSVTEVLVSVHEHPGARVSRPPGPRLALKAVMDKYRAELERQPRVYARYWYQMFLRYYWAGDGPGARRALFRSLRLDPRHPGRWVKLLALSGGTGCVRKAGEVSRALRAPGSRRARGGSASI